jgi:hypothetical protein
MRSLEKSSVPTSLLSPPLSPPASSRPSGDNRKRKIMESDDSGHDGDHDDDKISAAKSDNPLRLADNADDKPPAVSIANDDTTFRLFNFEIYGRKFLKRGEFKGYKKTYHRCTEEGCEACYYIFTNSSNMVKKYEKPHNHNPPAKPHACKEVKEKAEARLRAGDTPAAVHRDLVNDAPLPLSSAFAPALDTVRYWKKHISMKDIPSGILPTCLFFIFSFFHFSSSSSSLSLFHRHSHSFFIQEMHSSTLN